MKIQQEKADESNEKRILLCRDFYLFMVYHSDGDEIVAGESEQYANYACKLLVFLCLFVFFQSGKGDIFGTENIQADRLCSNQRHRNHRDFFIPFIFVSGN